jgi:hypothetical protein
LQELIVLLPCAVILPLCKLGHLSSVMKNMLMVIVFRLLLVPLEVLGPRDDAEL